jgi:carboxypeptidase family protein/TonB-dependent receptor-like protein
LNPPPADFMKQFPKDSVRASKDLLRARNTVPAQTGAQASSLAISASRTTLQPRRLRSSLKIFCAIVFIAILFAGFAHPASAQDFRGSVTGRVLDPSTAAIPAARITFLNTASNATMVAVTDYDGNYTIAYVTAGVYDVTVEATGFKKSLQRGVEVRVGDKLTIDFTLEVGEIREVVNVTNALPLLETASASSGQVIDGRRISELPLSDGNPFVLSRLAPGITYTGDLKFSRPFDNLGTSSVVAAGAPSGNEFTLDGTPNTQGREPRVAFVPPADAVQEFKVVTVSFDAQEGHTAGAVIDVTLRSGTNKFHGTAYEFVRNDVLSANDFFLNRAGQPRDALRYNRYGGTIGGPVLLPRFGEGGPSFVSRKNRAFFFFAYEALKDAFPEPTQFTVPTLAERRGDLSALLPLGIQIFDPLTAKQVGDRIERTPFANNIIPAERLSPIARNYLSFYPAPNQAGDAQGRNNFISPQPRSDTFNSETVRLDFKFNEQHSSFFNYTRNNRRESRFDWTGVISGINPTGQYLFRNNNGATYDHIYTHSATTVLNLRLGFTRFHSPTIRLHEGQFNPAQLGFSPATAAEFGSASYLPRFEIGGFSPIGDSLGGVFTDYIYTFQPTLTKIFGNHLAKFGYDLRFYRENASGQGHAAGRYDFGTNFTRGPFDNSAAASIGQELAAMLLGQPTGGFIDRNAARSNQTRYQALFVQDDWRATSRLSLNLGLRYEYEGGTTERFNRNVRGFDVITASPVEAAARVAYAANPIPEIAPASFNVRGGLLFANSDHRGFWVGDKNNFQPRIGLAYRIDDRTVIRGGWSIYAVPFGIDGVQQAGFTQPTNLIPTLDNGLTFRANLANPFPDGVTDPPGSSPGLATFIGRDIEFVPIDRKNGQAQRWQVSLQRELPGQWLVEASYIGDRGYDLNVETDALNALPRGYLSTSPIRDQATIDFLTANVINPFRGLAPDTSLNGDTVQRQQLLRPFPQFMNIRTRRNDGSSTYHSGQFRIEKRFSRGYTLSGSYTWSKLIEKVSFLNPTDTQFEKRISGNDAPHRIVISGIWQIPFNSKQGLGRRIGRLGRIFLKDWQVEGIVQVQSGRPLEFGNVFFAGDPSTLRAHIDGSTVDAVFDTSGFYFRDAAVQTNGVIDPVKQRADPRIRLSNNIRTLPSRLTGFRGQPLRLYDLSIIRSFRFNETTKLQFRAEFLNAFNHPQFSDPNLDPTSSSFARSTSQANLPRNIQLAIKLIF